MGRRHINVLVIQGAGLDQRGHTMVEIFGPETLDEINAGIRKAATDLGVQIQIVQTNDEAVAIETLQASKCDAVLINPGGFTVTAAALAEVLGTLEVPVYEVHGSNPAARGIQSVIAPVCKGTICGFGYAGYAMALRVLAGR